MATNILKGIQPIKKEDFHAAEVYWHKDNYNCFKTKDSKLRERILQYDEDGEATLNLIEELLMRNMEIADEILDERGEAIWKADGRDKFSRAVAIAASAGAVGIMSLYAGSEAADLFDTASRLYDLLVGQADMLNSTLDATYFGGEADSIVALGAGGLKAGGGGLA